MHDIEIIRRMNQREIERHKERERKREEYNHEMLMFYALRFIKDRKERERLTNRAA